MKFFKRIVSIVLIAAITFVMVSCGMPKEMNPEEFGKYLETRLDLVEDKEPFSYSLSGDTKFYRFYETISYTQVNAAYNDAIIYYSFYDSIPNADQIYSDAYENFSSTYSKEDGNRFSYFNEATYDYLIYEGINPLDELYFYGEVFHIGHTVIYVYTNTDSDSARSDVRDIIVALNLHEIK